MSAECPNVLVSVLVCALWPVHDGILLCWWQKATPHGGWKRRRRIHLVSAECPNVLVSV